MKNILSFGQEPFILQTTLRHKIYTMVRKLNYTDMMYKAQTQLVLEYTLKCSGYSRRGKEGMG